MTPAPALLVLGMHRSGTSCLAGMLEAAGVAAAGESVRNWDNARGHFERLELVRLNEAVLFRSGGHWLAAPGEVRWAEEEARERDRLLATRVAGRPALLKDPRTLLTLPFWRASAVPFRALGIVRHPLAVARSLRAWRGLPLAQGLALWGAHARALRADQARHGYPLVDFDAARDEVVSAVLAACRLLGVHADAAALAGAHDEFLVHHDDEDPPDEPELPAALELHAELLRRIVRPPGALATAAGSSRRFPRVLLERFERLAVARDFAAALPAAEEALRAASDPAAVAVPTVATLLRLRAHPEAEAFLARATMLEPGLGALLRGKLALARGDAHAAVEHLTTAASGPAPTFQALRLLPHALRAAGRRAEAEARLAALAPLALYPHGPLALLAEWAWEDGPRTAALARLPAALEAAPPHRRGRLRTRLAEWRLALGEPDEARAELRRALSEDPSFARAQRELARLESLGE
jgi:tetratricopeptide (TPR) repeat protein